MTRTKQSAPPRPPVDHIRWMLRKDLPQVLRIELDAFEHAWTEATFLRWLRHRHVLGYVYEAGDAVLGYMVYEFHKTKLEVVNLAVDPPRWRQGIGKALMDRLKSKLHWERRNRIDFYVWEQNLRGQLFLKSQGFRATGAEPGVWEDTPDEVGYRFLFRLPVPQPPQPETVVRIAN